MPSQLKGLVFLLVGLAVVAAPIVAYFALTGKDTSPLFSDLRGPRTATGDLIINPARGTFAGLRLGMPFAAAQQRLPAHRRCASLPPWNLSYCDGTGLTVTIATGCGLMAFVATRCPDGRKAGPLAGIEIGASTGYEFPNMRYAIRASVPGSQQAVTTGGVRLGTSLRRLRRIYVLTNGTPFGAGLCDGFGTVYTAVVGSNTAVFNIQGGVVTMMSIFPGREPRLCTRP
ncbi:MAG TPA: hypothetical protein VGL76_06590 [Gaiellaceae bacterium]